MDSVAPLTPEESAKYDNIDFDVEVYRYLYLLVHLYLYLVRQDMGAPGRLMHHDDKKKTLMARWR